MPAQDFDDRFTFDNPALASLTSAQFEALTDEQLETLSPEAANMAVMVRAHSLLLRRTSTKHIYRLITQQSDPRIGFILAAGRDREGNRLFPDMQTVKKVMFGPTVPDPTTYLDQVLNIYVQGIRRISVALTASILIAEFAPAELTEALRYALNLERQAIADLDRLLEVPDVELLTAVAPLDDESVAFYFEAKTLNLSSSALTVELYMPTANLTTWQMSGTYTGIVSTADIVADLATTINNVTLNAFDSNILAAPVLASPDSRHLHEIRFESRLRDVLISAELVSVRIRPSPLPFVWGINRNFLREETLNSVFTRVERAATTVTPLGRGQEEGDDNPTVLYFRRLASNNNGQVVTPSGDVLSDLSWQIANLTFRISPTMDSNLTVSVPYLTGPNQTELDLNRPSQVALLLLNELFAIKGDTRALGALIRNDDIAEPNAVAALELVAWSATNPETWMVLDVVEVPPDIELATGNRRVPLTPWSNKPRSIRVPSLYARDPMAANGVDRSVGIPDMRLVKLPDSARLRAALDYARRIVYH